MPQIDLGQVQATINVGTTTTVGGSTGASVTNSGTTANAVLDFTIPSGCYSIVECGSTDTTKELMPQTMYVWGEVSSLTITLAEVSAGNIVNEYMFSFNSGATAATLSVPADVKFTSTVTIEANMHYECNIMWDVNNEEFYGIIVGWPWTAPSA